VLWGPCGSIIFITPALILRLIAPFFSDFYFAPDDEGYVRLQWTNKFGAGIYDITDLSDGTIRFIALATLFLQPSPPAILIVDEPELGLHPFALGKLAGMIQSVAAKNVQVFVATQSADLINHFDAEDIITVDQHQGESKFIRLNKEVLSEWLEDNSIGDLWQRILFEEASHSSYEKVDHHLRRSDRN
jgi:predicted ATPase